MKNLFIGLALILVLFAFVACDPYGHGPVTVDASYPGSFLMYVSTQQKNGTFEYELIKPNPFGTFHGTFFNGQSLRVLSINSSKNPPDIAPQGDLGVLIVTVSGEFGTIEQRRELGDVSDINIYKWFY